LRWLENGKAAIDTTVMAIYVNNAKAASTLSVEDSFAFIWSDGVTRARAVLGSSIIWKANTEAIVVAVGSGVLPSDVTDIAGAVRAELATELARIDAAITTRATDASVLAAMNATPPAVNVKQVNDYIVTGAGVDGNTWGPA
jgi:hypothetical protein